MLPMNEVLSKLPSQKLRLENGVCDVHTLVTLPLDVQALIFAAIETLRDAVALSLTSSHLALAGWSRIKQLSKEKWARWSGDRILALPGHDRMAFWGGPTPECILAHSDIAAAVDDAGSLVRYLETFRPAKHQQCPPSLREIARISPQYDWRRFGGVSLCRYPLDAPWVICNLSQRVYVRTRRKNTAPNATPAQDGQGSAWYDRSNLTETLWETVPEKISSWERGTGRWATNRIAVCTLDKASATHDDWSEWTDITASQEGLS
ncbi:hypothetical protein PsYK624_064380 [Phanerochaete sordida]|uniref:Uncharacterized protein n=1 Tax=Phanerochaete sordida TaxID=48140 RepID=A0A9P3LD77_9APHY|nr:hypothetical protein PsYK624_064380 [Phanerochaete sordida]